jgi:hypothetical protein
MARLEARQTAPMSADAAASQAGIAARYSARLTSTWR